MRVIHSITQNRSAVRWCATALMLALAGYAAADDLTGQAGVIDGDTLEIHGTRIRLWGVDAPESSQLCRGDDSLTVSVRRQGGERSGCLYCKAAGKLPANLAGPIRSHGGDVLGRRR